jgi:hypothetical protein
MEQVNFGITFRTNFGTFYKYYTITKEVKETSGSGIYTNYATVTLYSDAGGTATVTASYGTVTASIEVTF